MPQERERFFTPADAQAAVEQAPADVLAALKKVDQALSGGDPRRAAELERLVGDDPVLGPWLDSLASTVADKILRERARRKKGGER